MAFAFKAPAEDITNALHAFLQQRVEVEKADAALVVGLVDEHGTRVITFGKMGDDTSREVNGDTLFEVGSITKTFTTLLLQDMVDRGEMKLDDPVAKYLPASVKVPARHGKQITLRHLATHTSGLPLVADNLDPKRADNPYADYTVEKLNAFLADYQLPCSPGTKYIYSELGMELLGYAIALKAGTNYESLVVDRICRPLGLDSTRVTLTPELKSRLVTGHDQLGHALPSLEFQTLVGGSGLHSTANDLLKYVSAQLGLTPSPLAPAMQKTHAVRFRSLRAKFALGWMVGYYPQGREFLMHGGGTPGCTTFISFDQRRRRGVVVLSSSNDLRDTGAIGFFLLISEWETGHRPEEIKISPSAFSSYIGEYRFSPNIQAGLLAIWLFLVNVPGAYLSLAAVICFVIVILAIFVHRRVAFFRRRWERRALRWRTYSIRKRRLILVCAVLLACLSTPITPLVAAYVTCAMAHPVVNIWREGDRLFVQATGSSHVPSKFKLPHVTGELRAENDARLFERISGLPLDFSRDARGNVTRLTAPLFGNQLSFIKISDQPSEPPKRPVAIRLDPKISNVFAGQYEFAPDDLFEDGIKLTLWRQGDRLLGRASDKKTDWGVFDVYAESETKFFFTLTIIPVELSFTKNDQGEVTSVTRHVALLPDSVGKKLNSFNAAKAAAPPAAP